MDDERFGLFRHWENPEDGDEPLATLTDRDTASIARLLEAAGAAALELAGKMLVRRS